MRNQPALLLLLICLALPFGAPLTAQKGSCPVKSDSVDPFDSLRTVVSNSVELGSFIFSRYETENGPRLTREGRCALTYTQSPENLQLYLLTLELPEYQFLPQPPRGQNVKFLMATDTIVGFYTISDEGVFNKETNMRHYQHSAVIPTNTFFLLAYEKIALIRVDYDGNQRTIAPTPQQQDAIMELFRCIGRRTGLFDVEP